MDTIEQIADTLQKGIVLIVRPSVMVSLVAQR